MTSENKEVKKAGLKVTLPRVKIFHILEGAGDRTMGAYDVYCTLLDQGQAVVLASE